MNQHPPVEASLFYDPPYERPLEDELAWHLVKYLSPISGLHYQVRTETPAQNVWVDFVIEQSERRIGIEIGSLNVENEQKTAFRDALVMGSGSLDVLYRLPGGALMHRLHDIILVMSQWDRDLFSEHGRRNLHTLASPEARAARPRPQDSSFTFDLVEPCVPKDDDFVYPGLDMPTQICVRRLARSNPGAWLRTYDDALTHYGVTPTADDLNF